ncbi:unnamed protein product [Ixodes persulcatus]
MCYQTLSSPTSAGKKRKQTKSSRFAKKVPRVTFISFCPKTGSPQRSNAIFIIAVDSIPLFEK